MSLENWRFPTQTLPSWPQDLARTGQSQVIWALSGPFKGQGQLKIFCPDITLLTPRSSQLEHPLYSLCLSLLIKKKNLMFKLFLSSLTPFYLANSHLPPPLHPRQDWLMTSLLHLNSKWSLFHGMQVHHRGFHFLLSFFFLFFSCFCLFFSLLLCFPFPFSFILLTFLLSLHKLSF